MSSRVSSCGSLSASFIAVLSSAAWFPLKLFTDGLACLFRFRPLCGCGTKDAMTCLNRARPYGDERSWFGGKNKKSGMRRISFL